MPLSPNAKLRLGVAVVRQIERIVRRSMDDDAWEQLLPLARITAEITMCQICDHALERVSDCGIEWCEDKANGRTHSHCEHECFCTMVGCMPRQSER